MRGREEGRRAGRQAGFYRIVSYAGYDTGTFGECVRSAGRSCGRKGKEKKKKKERLFV